MAHHAIGADRFSGFREQQVLFGRPATTGGAGFGINDDALTFNQPLLQQGIKANRLAVGKQPGAPTNLASARASPAHSTRP